MRLHLITTKRKNKFVKKVIISAKTLMEFQSKFAPKTKFPGKCFRMANSCHSKRSHKTSSWREFYQESCSIRKSGLF